MSTLEITVLSIEKRLNSLDYKKIKPWVGTDIKVMGIRKDKNIEVTCCIPLISKYVNNLEDYKEKINDVKNDIRNIIKDNFPDNNIRIYLNTRDNYANNDLYMTLIGSAIESGDEGAVGRGNRSRGVIPFCRNLSMEAPCGKNHTGKIFTAIGDVISKKIYDKYKIENVIYLTSKMGDDITNPWNISVELHNNVSDDIIKEIDLMIVNIINNHEKITKDIVNSNIKLNSY